MTKNLVAPSLVGTIADLQTFDGLFLYDGHMAIVGNVNGVARRYRWTVGSTAVDATQILAIAPTGNPGLGKWLRADPVFEAKLPWVFNTANNTTLLTVPVGMRLNVIRTTPQITTNMGGVDTGSLGLDSNVSLNPGGLAVVTGLLTVGYDGAQGAEIDTPKRTSLVAGDVLRHNLLVAGFTSGAGNWLVTLQQLES